MGGSLKHGQTLKMEGEGILELRGAANSVPVRAEVTWFERSEKTAGRLPGDLLHVVARFDVALPAFGIGRRARTEALRSRDRVGRSD
jgi:hypothetical protein